MNNAISIGVYARLNQKKITKIKLVKTESTITFETIK
jgi:hypothetical protein